jgi:exonuclease SbcD
MFKFLHASDLHIGRTIREHSRIGEHNAFFDWLLALAGDEQVDAILISGDVFHEKTPTLETRELLVDFFARCIDKKLRVVMIPGNHDNEGELAALRPLAEKGNYIRVVTGFEGADNIVEVPYGAGDLVTVGCLPYIHPHRVLTSAEGTQLTERERLNNYRDWIANTLQWMTQTMQLRGKPSLLMLHPQLTNSPRSGSESLSIFPIPVECLPATLKYIACGHIHKPQKIEGALSPTYYAGSPLKLSFGEHDIKTVNIVEIEAHTQTRIIHQAVEGPRDVLRLTGTGAELVPLVEAQKGNWMEIVMSDPDTVEHGVLNHLRSFPEIISWRFGSMEKTLEDIGVAPVEGKREPTAEERFRGYLTYKGRPQDEQLIRLFMRLHEEELEEGGGE